jgi:predicted nucleic acid-binding protein
VILVDTTPLVALVDARDNLHPRALADLDRLAGRPLFTCSAVLTEACFLLEHPVQRRRLERILSALAISPVAAEHEVSVRDDVFRWLDRYADHQPDWSDGTLVVLSGHQSRAKVWTYDGDFRTIWRRLDGSAVPLAVKS